MIYTLTFSPSVDYIVEVDHFRVGEINRTASEKVLPGGKGLNVSMVLSNLGHESVALGFLAGFTGREIEKRLREAGCRTDFIHVREGFSRINLKMISNGETAINGQGPKITPEDITKLEKKLEQLQAGDILVISGSIPKSLPENMYERIMAGFAGRPDCGNGVSSFDGMNAPLDSASADWQDSASDDRPAEGPEGRPESRLSKRDEWDEWDGRGIRFVVDAEGPLLTKALKYHPFLIKPNQEELEGIFGVPLKSHQEVIPYARKLQQEGARNVLVSMGERGAVLVTETGKVLCAAAPKIRVVNTVGAGDSMVAGFLAGYLESDEDYEPAFLTALAAGSASAASTELAVRQEMEALRKRIRILDEDAGLARESCPPHPCASSRSVYSSSGKLIP